MGLWGAEASHLITATFGRDLPSVVGDVHVLFVPEYALAMGWVGGVVAFRRAELEKGVAFLVVQPT